MGTSKKPRKKYVPRMKSTGLSNGFVEGVTQDLLTAMLKIMARLPAGNAEMTDIFRIREFIACTLVGLMCRNTFDEREASEAAEVLVKAAKMLEPLVLRTQKTGGRIVCTGDELVTIREATQIAYQFITDSLEVCPREVSFEYLVGLRILEGKDDFTKRALTKSTVKGIMANVKNDFSYVSSYVRAMRDGL